MCVTFCVNTLFRETKVTFRLSVTFRVSVTFRGPTNAPTDATTWITTARSWNNEQELLF